MCTIARKIRRVFPTFLILLTRSAIGQEVEPPAIPPAPRPFRIEVVDQETGRGVPLVELRTVNQLRFVTDSNGIVAFDEPGLLGLKVFFFVKSHGYEYPKDGFGSRGVAVETKPGGRARITLPRINIARRLYRVTGGGIYRDSLLTSTPIPEVEPLLNGQVLGQDSVLTAVFQGKLHWYWGDTNRPSYPLGNFHTPGATSDLPERGGLDPAKGVRLTYFLDPSGFARPTCQMPGEGPTWITGLVVLRDREGKERMFANYAKIKPPMETYQRGLVEWDPSEQTFNKQAEYPIDVAAYPGEHPGGHTIQAGEEGVDYIYYCSPYPLVRVLANPGALANPDSWEAFTCLQAGTRADQKKLDRAPDGSLRYAWKKRTQILSQEQQAKFVKDGLMKAEEGLLHLRDVTTGNPVLAHGGSVAWNPYRNRWVMIAVQAFGSSFLGEVWYAEADTRLGPWVFARKIVTHEDYSFYNPRHHEMLDQEDGRVIYFEGTYTSSFSGSKDPTPRYDYNQVMYQLDLSDPRLALPVAVYRKAGDPGSPLHTRAMPEFDPAADEIAFFAADRPGIATIALPLGPVETPSTSKPDRGGTTAQRGPGTPETLFLVAGDREPAPSGTTPLYEFEGQSGREPLRYLSVDQEPRPGYRRVAQPKGRVWTNPGRRVVP